MEPFPPIFATSPTASSRFKRHPNTAAMSQAMPLLSVLEQNAKVIRDFPGDDRLILEHHSNLIRTPHAKEELDENELLTETWNAPVVITTLPSSKGAAPKLSF